MMHLEAGIHLQRTTRVLLLFAFFLQPYVFSQTGLHSDTFKATDTSSTSSAVSTSFPPNVKRKCGGHYDTLTGTITSPDFPNNYTDLLICEWLISLDFTTRISLYIYEYDIENSPNCKYDSLQIRDGDNSSSPVLNTICGSYNGYRQIEISSDSKLFLRFVSNWNTTGRGFKANWTIVCEQYISNENGSLKSPNYPSAYPQFMQCNYFFYSLQPGQKIIFTFIDIDLQKEYANGSCINDYVEIINQPRWDTESPIMKRFCGNTLPEEVVSYSDTTVRFISDGAVAGYGYHLRYHRSLTRDCGNSILNGEEGIIKSPGFPGSYPDHISCTWTIQVKSGCVIHLAFDSMNLGWWNIGEGGVGEKCLWGSWRGVLQVFDGPAQEKGTSVGIYCCNGAPLPIISNGSSMTLVFTSYYNYEMWTGFKATYTALENFTGGPRDDKA